MSDPYARYMAQFQPASVEEALRLFDESTKVPEYSSPHVVNWEWVLTNLSWNDHRRKVLDQFEDLLKSVEGCGVNVDLVMIGGSFLSSTEMPSDIDVLFVYRISDSFCDGQFNKVVTSKCPLVDFRVVPADAGALVLIKTAIFNHTLFQGRDGGRGSILLSIESTEKV
jgi:hypothetical protein